MSTCGSHDLVAPVRPAPINKQFTPAEINFTPGERSFVAWISMDVVDIEGDVVVPSGVDYESVFMGVQGDPSHPGNPVVMAVHDYQRWPIGTCEWIKVARPSRRLQFSGLYSKTLIDEDPDALKVFGMIQRRVVRGISIGFRPPEDFRPGEWGPPTQAELAARPDWATARRVIRRCVLLEYSVVPIPMNQSSLIVAVSKGLELPSFLQDKVSVMTSTRSRIFGKAEADPDASNSPQAGDHVRIHAQAGGGCGVVRSLHKSGPVPGVHEEADGCDDGPAAKVELHDAQCRATGVLKAVRCCHLTPLDPGDPDDAEGVTSQDKALAESSGTSGGYVVPPEHGHEDKEAAEDQSEPASTPAPIRKGDYVKWERHRDVPAGCGRVASIHKAGVVPGVANTIEASEDTPAARVKLYKSMDDPHHFHESDHHVGVFVHKCARMDSMRFTTGAKHARAIPPFRTQAQWLASVERLTRERLALEPEDDLVGETLDRIHGTI